MTDREMLELAAKAGGYARHEYVENSARDGRAAIEQHVAEAVAREREECAKACEDVATTQWDEYAASYNSAVFDCAAAIRARAGKETT